MLYNVPSIRNIIQYVNILRIYLHYFEIYFITNLEDQKHKRNKIM